MRSIEHRFDLFPTPEVTVSTMTLNRATVSRTAGRRTATDRLAAGPGVAATRATGRPASGPALSLTRRGRATLTVAGLLLLVLATVAAVLLVGGTAAAGRDARPLPTRYHVVLPGETLWQIAAEVDATGDPRDTVARIRELNRLQSAELSAGTRLALPVAG